MHGFTHGHASSDDVHSLGEGVLEAVAGALGSMAKHHGTVDRLHDLARRKPKHIEAGAASFFLEIGAETGATNSRISDKMDAAAAAHLHDALQRAARLTGLSGAAGGGDNARDACVPEEITGTDKKGAGETNAVLGSVMDEPEVAASEGVDDGINYSLRAETFRRRLAAVVAVKDAYAAPCRKKELQEKLEEDPVKAWEAVEAEFTEFVDGDDEELRKAKDLAIAHSVDQAIEKLATVAATHVASLEARVRELEVKEKAQLATRPQLNVTREVPETSIGEELATLFKEEYALVRNSTAKSSSELFEFVQLIKFVVSYQVWVDARLLIQSPVNDPPPPPPGFANRLIWLCSLCRFTNHSNPGATLHALTRTFPLLYSPTS
jgi:hypothetical protein